MDHLLSPLVKLHEFFADFLLLRLVFFPVITFDFLGTLPVSPTVAWHCPWSSLALAWVGLGRAAQSPWPERRNSPGWLGGWIDLVRLFAEIDSNGESFRVGTADLAVTKAPAAVVVSRFSLLIVWLDRALSDIKMVFGWFGRNCNILAWQRSFSLHIRGSWTIIFHHTKFIIRVSIKTWCFFFITITPPPMQTDSNWMSFGTLILVFTKANLAEAHAHSIIVDEITRLVSASSSIIVNAFCLGFFITLSVFEWDFLCIIFSFLSTSFNEVFNLFLKSCIFGYKHSIWIIGFIQSLL